MFRLFGFVAVLLLATQSVAAADQPLREVNHFDNDVKLVRASNACHFEIRGHFVGESIFTLFYDKAGNVVKEIDVFPSLKETIYAPSRPGESYTSESPAVLIQYYTNNAALGSPVTATLTGLVERIPGVGIDAGRDVLQGTVTGYDAAGVPLNTFTSVVSSSGPEFPQQIGIERCAFFQQ